MEVAFMVSLSNHEGLAQPANSWFDKLTMKRFSIPVVAEPSQPGNQV